jgi:hypothetical protein
MLYEPLHDEAHDPVMRLFDSIDFSEVQSVQLVAGFRGTGKTTEFSRLEKLLWEDDFLVIRVDLDDYLDMNSPVEVSGVTADTPDRVIAVARRGYYPLYSDEVQVLRKIALAKDLGAVASTEQHYLERFLDSQLVLCYLDLEFWYDVHPLVRQGVLDADPEGT